MGKADENIEALREALAHSPGNVPLRRHLARHLADAGRLDEAEAELRTALARAPADEDVKLDLAAVFAAAGKGSEAFVIVEDLIRNGKHPAPAYVLHARLLLAAGDVQRAVREYGKALDADPEAADAELSERLGVRAEPDPDADDEDEIVGGRVRMWTDGDDDEQDVELERPDLDFSGVGGMDALKDQIRKKIIHPLEHPELYEAYGKSVGGGILMYGPPGCGKTHIARATAGEVDATFLAIGIHDVLDMWIGNSERRLHAIFERARDNAPCVVFFDEVDALGASRTDMKHSGARNVINQFLSELDGVKATNDGVLVLAATNAPWHVDPAFRRPGRFDRILFVPPPDRDARAAILDIHLEGKPTADVDTGAVAKKCADFSGADLKSVIDTAIERKLDDAIRSGVPEPLTTKDLVRAAKGLSPTTREWFTTARNYAVYSNQGGFYDDILDYLELR